MSYLHAPSPEAGAAAAPKPTRDPIWQTLAASAIGLFVLPWLLLLIPLAAGYTGQRRTETMSNNPVPLGVVLYVLGFLLLLVVVAVVNAKPWAGVVTGAVYVPIAVMMILTPRTMARLQYHLDAVLPDTRGLVSTVLYSATIMQVGLLVAMFCLGVGLSGLFRNRANRLGRVSPAIRRVLFTLGGVPALCAVLLGFGVLAMRLYTEIQVMLRQDVGTVLALLALAVVLLLVVGVCGAGSSLPFFVSGGLLALLGAVAIGWPVGLWVMLEQVLPVGAVNLLYLGYPSFIAAVLLGCGLALAWQHRTPAPGRPWASTN